MVFVRRALIIVLPPEQAPGRSQARGLRRIKENMQTGKGRQLPALW